MLEFHRVRETPSPLAIPTTAVYNSPGTGGSPYYRERPPPRPWVGFEMARTREKTSGGVGCGLLLLLSAAAVVGAGVAAYRHGPQWPRVLLHRPPGVVIHHSATGATAGGRTVDADFIDLAHERRGWGITDGEVEYHIGYHYVILPDGTIENGRPEWLPGAHATGANEYVGICLVGNFSTTGNPAGAEQPARPTEAQMRSLTKLVQSLMRKYRFGADRVYGHRDFVATDCPGDRFPMDAFRHDLATD